MTDRDTTKVEDMANFKARCEKFESAIKIIWTWAHCAKEDPLLHSPIGTCRIQFGQIEKKAEEVLK